MSTIQYMMSSPYKLFKQFSCNSSKMWFSRSINTRAVGAPIDKETMDTMYTDNWGRRDNNIPVKEEIKLMVKEEISKAKQQHAENHCHW